MKKHIRSLNRSVITLRIALNAAKRLGVKVHFVPDLGGDNGYYLPPKLGRNSKPYIYIEASLSEEKQARTVAHELTHAVCHIASNLIFASNGKALYEDSFDAKQNRYQRSRFEREALEIESLSMIPKNQLHRAQQELFDANEQRDEYTDQLWKIRLELQQKGL